MTSSLKVPAPQSHEATPKDPRREVQQVSFSSRPFLSFLSFPFSPALVPPAMNASFQNLRTELDAAVRVARARKPAHLNLVYVDITRDFRSDLLKEFPDIDHAGELRWNQLGRRVFPTLSPRSRSDFCSFQVLASRDSR